MQNPWAHFSAVSCVPLNFGFSSVSVASSNFLPLSCDLTPSATQEKAQCDLAST